MQDNVAIIRNFIAAWSRLDADELTGYFTENSIYYNVPAKPVSGRENLRRFIAGFIASWTKTDWDVLTIMGEGDRVVAERLDRTRIGDLSVNLPCCGVFELQDGKIAVWRDYFDMATYTNAVNG